MITAERPDGEKIELPFIRTVNCSTTDYGSRETKITFNGKPEETKTAIAEFVENVPEIEILYVTDESNGLIGYFFPNRIARLLAQSDV